MDAQKFNAILEVAQHEAVRRRHLYMTTEHLLWSLLKTPEVKRAFRACGVQADEVSDEIEEGFKLLESDQDHEMEDEALAVMTPDVEQVLYQTMQHGVSAQVRFPRAIDFVIIMLDNFKPSVSPAVNILESHGLTSLALKKWAAAHPDRHAPKEDEEEANDNTIEIFHVAGPFSPKETGKKITESLSRMLLDVVKKKLGVTPDEDKHEDEADSRNVFKGHFINFMPGGMGAFEEVPDEELNDVDGEEDENTPSMDMEEIRRFIRKTHGALSDLTQRAAKGSLDPVIGRDDEISACIQTLLRRNKRNVLILGESGVGKTSVVYGLAQRIVQGKVPPQLFGYMILSLDMPSLMAGTQFRGQLEDKIKLITDGLRRIPNAILFVDEIQMISQRSGGRDEPSVLTYFKPGLVDGTLRIIGTTTQQEARNNILSDTALMRRFYVLNVMPPDMSLTRQILTGILGKFEEHHDVRIEADAVEATLDLCERYMADKTFPDKAIDVIDEAGAKNRICPPEAQKKVLTRDDMEAVVAKIANIPDITASKDERVQLRDADERLKKVVFGQDEAITTVIRLIKLSRAGLRAPDKPVASLLFAGPTGVGKTEIAKQLANILNIAFVRFDMSEYTESYTASKLIGSAPGYVGYEKGGLLTEAIRANPRCVLLLDEIEKAHSSIFDLFLQVMDAARLTDNNGKTADFKNVILIMTSNAGGREMGQHAIGFGSSIDVSKSQKAVEKMFSPEFRNRLDEVVMFNPLEPEVMTKIVNKLVGELEGRVASKGIRIVLTDEARAWLAEKGYDAFMGARPLSRLVQTEIAFKLSDAILFDGLEKGGVACVDVAKDGQTLTLKAEVGAVVDTPTR